MVVSIFKPSIQEAEVGGSQSDTGSWGYRETLSKNNNNKNNTHSNSCSLENC